MELSLRSWGGTAARRGPRARPKAVLIVSSHPARRLLIVTAHDRPMTTKTKRTLVAAAVVTAVLGLGAAAWATDSPARPSVNAAANGAVAARIGGRHPLAGALFRRAVHGDLVVKDRTGQFVTVTVDKGKVTGHTPTSITLQRADGKSVTLALDSSTRYRGIASASEIADGKGAVVVSKGGTATVVAQRGNTTASASVDSSGEQVPAA